MLLAVLWLEFLITGGDVGNASAPQLTHDHSW